MPDPVHCTPQASSPTQWDRLLPTPLTDEKAKGKRGQFAQIHVASGIPGPKCFPSTPNHHTSVPTLSEDRCELEPGTWPSSWQCEGRAGTQACGPRWEGATPQLRANLQGTSAGRHPGPHLEIHPHAHHDLLLFPFQQKHCDVSVPLVWPIFPMSPPPPCPQHSHPLSQ